MKKNAVSKQILILLDQLDEASYVEAKSILEGHVSHIQGRQALDFLSAQMSQKQPEMRAFWIGAILEIAHGNKAFHHLPHLQKRYAQLQENIAFDAWSREKLFEAATAFENASNAYLAAGMQSKWRKCCKNFATATTLVGKARGQITDLETAISAYTECLDSLGPDNGGSLKAELFADIGYALLGIGQINNNHKILQQAAENYECALSILDEKDDQALWGRAKNSLGAVNSKLGDLTADANLIRYSISLYQDALRVRKIETEPSVWLNTMTNILHCEFLLCGLTGAIPRLRDKTVLLVNMLSENSNRQFGRTQIAHTYRQIASNYHWIGEHSNSASDLRQAVFFYRKSIKFFTRKKHSYSWAQITSHIATALFRIGVLDDDTDMLKQSLSIHKDIQDIFDRKSKPFWWANWHRAVGDLNAELYKRENHHKYLLLAIEAYEDALKEYKKDIYPLQWAQTTRRLCLRLSQKPAFLRDWNKIAELSAELISSIHGMALLSSSKLQQRALLSSLSGVGDLSAATYCHLKEYEKAFQYLSLSRAVSTELALRLNEEQGHGDDFSTSNWQRIRAKFDERLSSGLSGSGDLQVLNAEELLELECEHKKFLEEMNVRGISEPDYIKISQFTQNMTSDEVFLAVFVSECGGGVIFLEKDMCAIPDDNVIFISDLTTTTVLNLLNGPLQDGRAGWQKSYEKYRQESGANNLTVRENAIIEWNGYIELFLPELWELLMGAIAEWLGNNSKSSQAELFLMLPGLLSILPLHAARPHDNSRPYFIENWPVSYVPNPRIFLTRKNKPITQDGDSLLAVTDPIGDIGEDVNPAWSFFDESHRHSIKPTAIQFLSEFEAGQNWTYLSFFCHGIWNAGEPDQSHLMMSDHSVLSAEQLQNMNLNNVRLVVLGACESALIGTKHTPDEFIGLPVAFLQSGAHSVAASQWIVDVSSTYNIVLKLMSEHKKGLSPARALRNAQCAFIAGEFEELETHGLLSKYRTSLSNLRTLSAFGDKASAQNWIDSEAASYSLSSKSEMPTSQSPFFWAAFSITGF